MKRVIIVGSAGSPTQVIELLKFGEPVYFPIVLCIHLTSAVIETFAEHITRETQLPTVVVNGPTKLTNGIHLPAGGKDIIFLTRDLVTVKEGPGKIHPSISMLFLSLKKVADENFIVIVLGGLGDDGKNEAKSLLKKKVRFLIQEDAEFPYLPRNIHRELGERSEPRTFAEIKSILKSINKDAR
ncbi:chemotaxis protein CheB [Fervidobacterium thailandense]|uniref:protein-glutamate methylesterase n=1 Tax=Fervidobacterium thailandense TaxID=1008305 RepID=A0A1E3G3X6_9BACT|nr:chemotaxis protein CheB [Fervidobacterium thailandense]ODN30388.1 hypothetical protein A4H02_05950 [Fervidobacterium thailandense]